MGIKNLHFTVSGENERSHSIPIKLVRVKAPLGRVYNDLTKKVEYWSEFDLGLKYGIESRVVRVCGEIEEYPESHHIE